MPLIKIREKMPLTSKLIPRKEPSTETLTGSLQATRCMHILLLYVSQYFILNTIHLNTGETVFLSYHV